MCVIFLIVSLCVKCFSFSVKAHRLWSLCTLLLTIASQVFFLQFSSAYYEFYSKVNPQNNLFSSAGHRFLCWLRKAPLDWISQLADTWGKKTFRKLGSKSSNTRCSISVSLRYASFPSPPLSVWNRFPVCGEFVPLLALLCRHMLGFMMPLDGRSASSPCLTY